MLVCLLCAIVAEVQVAIHLRVALPRRRRHVLDVRSRFHPSVEVKRAAEKIVVDLVSNLLLEPTSSTALRKEAREVVLLSLAYTGLGA